MEKPVTFYLLGHFTGPELAETMGRAESTVRAMANGSRSEEGVTPEAWARVYAELEAKRADLDSLLQDVVLRM